MARKAKQVQETSMHLDNKKEMTKAPGEKMHNGGTLMDGIVGGLAKHTSPPIIDGIVRGISRNSSEAVKPDLTLIHPSATKKLAGSFGGGNFAEGKL